MKLLVIVSWETTFPEFSSWGLPLDPIAFFAVFPLSTPVSPFFAVILE